MNSFIKNNKRFFSLLLGISLSSSLHALTINNQPLESIISRDKAFLGTIEEKNRMIILETENGNLNLTSYDINSITNLKELFQQVKKIASGCSIQSRTCIISSNTVNYKRSYLTGLELMDIQAKTSLEFTDCIFESPLIQVTGNTMIFRDCFFINPQTLIIIVDFPGSDYKVIKIVFHDQPEYPTFINGQLDLKDNQTKQRLMLSNVKEITIEFNPQAWNN